MLHAGLLAGGPVGWAAFAVITAVLVLGAGAGGAFDQEDVRDEDYNEDGVYVPTFPNPHPDPSPVPPVNPDPNEDTTPEYPLPHPNPNPDPVVPELVYPWGFVFVTSSVPEGSDEPDDIPDDIRPPSCSFAMAAEPYDSGAGAMIAAVAVFFMVFYGLRFILEGRE